MYLFKAIQPLAIAVLVATLITAVPVIQGDTLIKRSSAQFAPPSGKTYFVVGQNYEDEVSLSLTTSSLSSPI
jgi:hypothetical protein